MGNNPTISPGHHRVYTEKEVNICQGVDPYVAVHIYNTAVKCV